MNNIPKEDLRMVLYTAECWSEIIYSRYHDLRKIMEKEDFRQELSIAGIESYRKWIETPGNSERDRRDYSEGKGSLLSYLINAMKFRAKRLVYVSKMQVRKANFEDNIPVIHSDDYEQALEGQQKSTILKDDTSQYKVSDILMVIEGMEISKFERRILQTIIASPIMDLQPSGSISIPTIQKDLGRVKKKSIIAALDKLRSNPELKKMVGVA